MLLSSCKIQVIKGSKIYFIILQLPGILYTPTEIYPSLDGVT
ncbi:hypothetical protein LEP1GSC172_0799 [Leptospira noguchii]|uniref:Uncharacterized protein n=1 Tax=Leptospira noguchii TaxID=28182 RepID=M6VRA0_9LEPT|nr:hypothetical protein LEP1GSC172_0799 [Leptospira noguchii]